MEQATVELRGVGMKVVLPIALTVGMLSAAMGAGAAYQFMTTTLNDLKTENTQSKKDATDRASRIRSLEDDNRDQKLQIQQLQNLVAVLSNASDSYKDEFRRRFEELQSAVTRIQTLLEVAQTPDGMKKKPFSPPEGMIK